MNANMTAAFVPIIAHHEGASPPSARRQQPVTGQVRAAAFAQAILNRYTMQSWAWPLLVLAFRRLGPGIVLQTVYEHRHLHQNLRNTHIQFAPQLELTAFSWLSAPGAPAKSRPVFAFRLHLEPMTQVRTLDLAHARPASAAQLLTRRLLARGEHIVANPQSAAVNASGRIKSPSANAHLADGGEQPRTFTPNVPPVGQVVRKVQSKVDTRDDAVRAKSNPRAATPGDITRPQTGSRGLDPTVDVNRLTDQVIQAIDRRIIAQRERAGRP